MALAAARWLVLISALIGLLSGESPEDSARSGDDLLAERERGRTSEGKKMRE